MLTCGNFGKENPFFFRFGAAKAFCEDMKSRTTMRSQQHLKYFILMII